MIQPTRRKRERFLPWLMLVQDIVLVYLAFIFVFWVRFESGYLHTTLDPSDYDVYFKTFHLMMLITVFFIRFYGLYKIKTLSENLADEIWRILKAVTSSTLLLTAITFFVRSFSFSRTFLLLCGIVLSILVIFGRILLSKILVSIDWKRGSLKNVLIIGINQNSQHLIHYYNSNRRLCTKVIGILDDKTNADQSFCGVPILGRVEELPKFLVKDLMVHEVVLSLPSLNSDEVLKILYECEKEMVNFKWIADMLGLMTAKMSVSYIGKTSVLSFTDSPLSDWENRFIKRFMDILLSAVGLMILSPLLILLAILVKVTSKGPIFFKQERVGEDGRHFMILKFRTMKENAESASGPVWAKPDDDRRTPIGAFLRENNLDELPQLWNVFIGDMSLVGPRPERPFFTSQFKENIPRYMARHSIRSGLSGWAQVNGLRGNTSIEERTKFDLYYIENWSLFLDIKILFMTLFAKRNAY